MSVYDDIVAARVPDGVRASYSTGELALAAASIALRTRPDGADTPIYAALGRQPFAAEKNLGWVGLGNLIWPFAEEFPHHLPRRERLVAAAAFLVAEIEMIDAGVEL